MDTPGGRFYAEWDDQAPVTREGQLIFFFQFLQAGGRWEEYSLKPKTGEEQQNKGFRLLGFTAPAGDRVVLDVGWKLVE